MLKVIENQGVLGVHLQGLAFIFFFSCGNSAICCSNVEIEFGKNPKIKIYKSALKKTLPGRPTCMCSYGKVFISLRGDPNKI